MTESEFELSQTLVAELCCTTREETKILILIFKEAPLSSQFGIQPLRPSLSSSNAPKASSQ